MPDYKNIVCCTDFSHNAEHAFEEASYIASLTGARLSLLHVIHAGSGEAAMALPADQREAEEAEVLRNLEAVYGPRATVETDIVVTTGDVPVEILSYAEDVGAGLIVIGARGVGRLEGFLGGGSIAERIVRTSRIPVLVVGAPGRSSHQRHGADTHDNEVPLVVKEVREAQGRERQAGLRDAD